MDAQTREYYEGRAPEFAARTVHLDMADLRERFLSCLQPGGRILDAGCGSGRDLAAFRQAGFDACGIDGSPKMCEQARELSGAEVTCLDFAEVGGPARFAGIWASASLLHVPRRELPGVLAGFHAALLPGGVLYVSFKRGSGEERRDGRLFVDYTLPEARKALEGAGLFRMEEAFETADVRPGYEERPWVNLIARARDGADKPGGLV